jgi:hypothetical protein
MMARLDSVSVLAAALWISIDLDYRLIRPKLLHAKFARL